MSLTTKAQLDAQLDASELSRDLTGSLEQCKEELRDAYMSFKDLKDRCKIQVKPTTAIGVTTITCQQSGGEGPADENPVFYFKPETFLLEEPEKQRQFRAELLRQVGSVPRAEPLTMLGDEMHRAMCEVVADRATPTKQRRMLTEYFRRRLYGLQHQKYKLLCRWAHHVVTAECAENLGPEATFVFGKLEYSLEQATLRCDRLQNEDFYDSATPENRPSTRISSEQASLYIEKFDLQPQTFIREDDIQVYMRAVSHRNKLLKTVNKYISRLKWLPMARKYEIYEGAVSSLFAQKRRNLQRQADESEKVATSIHSQNVMTPEATKHLESLLQAHHCKRYERMFLSSNDRLLHSWKDNHDCVPSLIADNCLLKLKVVRLALKYGLSGNIDLDQGFSFSYQVTTFFPAHFQRQLIKSKFSLYDFQEDEDPNKVKKRSLSMAARIDTNLFRDLSTNKASVPDDTTIQSELKSIDIKVMRLKASHYWLSYVVLAAEQPSWFLRQRAILHCCDNSADELLSTGFRFLEVGDLATINRINEENTQLHLRNVKRLAEHNPHDQISTVTFATSDGDKRVDVDKMPKTCLQRQADNIETHLLPAVVEHDREGVEETDDKKTGLDNNKQLPKFSTLQSHLITAYQTLRYACANDAKIRLMYTLNYYRTIQKRLALDLREFATRDRMNGFHACPVVQSGEASTHVQNQASFTTQALEKLTSKKMTESVAVDKQDLAAQMKFRFEGKFSNQVLTTCPSMPKYHAAHGEPIVRQTLDEPTESTHISQRAIKLLGRIEYIELNECLKEVYVRDDFGIYIMHDCVAQDMSQLQEELIRIGSHYIHRSEKLLDPSKQRRSLPQCDRMEIIKDLLGWEADFQFAKVKLCQVYMECYEHVTDPLEQQRLMQIVTDTMARRPRLNLDANYFTDAYEAEIECLEKTFELVKTLVDMQIHLEKTENKRLQDSLGLSYFLANEHMARKWKYEDAETFLCKIVQKNNQPKDEGTQASNTHHSLQVSENDDKEEKQKSQKIWGDTSSSDSEEASEYQQDDGDKYRRMLGLQKISLESIYKNYQEKDLDILRLMGEHAHFVELHEGYPEFLTRLTHGAILDKGREFKPNAWSQETGALDFYETLDFINRFHAVSHQAQQELYDGLAPWSDTMMTHIDIQVVQHQLDELHRVISIQEGTTLEYQGRALLEDESVMGSSEKMMFYAKEMIADLSKKPKLLLNPFVMAKLSLNSVRHFEFPEMSAELNKYANERKGVTGYSYVKKYERAALVGVAKSKIQGEGDFNSEVNEYMKGNVGDALNLRRIDVPSLLTIFCNMSELHRLRSELILTMAECTVLQEIYVQQGRSVGLKEAKLLCDGGISFEMSDLDTRLINWFDDGPAHMDKIELAVKEFDPRLVSNLNFRNPDSFKLNILTAGLEEVRAVLQYQLLQKHILIVATRINALTIDSHLRGLVELELLQSKKIAVPNPFIRYQAVINRQTDTLNLQAIRAERSAIKSALNTYCLPIFYNIMPKKSSQRGQIAKDFSSHYSNVVQSQNPYLVQRIMRAYKVKLLNRFVQQALTEVYLDAQKVQALRTVQKLRVYDRLFQFDPTSLGMAASDQQAVFQYDSSLFQENFTANYCPAPWTAEQDQKNGSKGQKKQELVKAINADSYSIGNHYALPSSQAILAVESTPIEDLRLFKKKRQEIRCEVLGREVNDDLKTTTFDENSCPEKQLKELLPTFTPTQSRRSQEDSSLDYQEALYFSESKFAGLIRYYAALERVLQIEWFTCKLQLRPDEQILIEQAIRSGTAFWHEDEFDARVSKSVAKPMQGSQGRAFTQLHEKSVNLRSKRNLAEVVQGFALTIKSFIAQYQKTKEDQRNNYLDQYVDFGYQQIVGSLHKLVVQFLRQNNFEAVKQVKQAIRQITKMGHQKVVFLKPNNYAVSTHLVSAESARLESSDLIYGSVQHADLINFKRCIQPIINEKAMEPPQLALFQALYQQDSLKRSYPSQFPGQLSSISHEPLKPLETILLELNQEARGYSQSFIRQAKAQANDFMETVYNDQSLGKHSREDVYSLDQLLDARKFFNEQLQALMLRNALMSWFQNSPLPDDRETNEKFEASFRQNFFWKQLQKKEELTKKLNLTGQYGQIPSEKQLADLKMKIDTLAEDQSLATLDQVQRRDALVKSLKEEFQALKKKVTLDQYFGMKAEIQVFSNEIEKFIIKASVQALDSEQRALTKCFSMTSHQLQFHIHPFQTFAATLFDQCDPLKHLDITNRVTAAQKLLTKMRNRSTEIDVLTAGPGMVISIKDINDIMSEFCRDILKDHQVAFKSRIETQHLMEQDFRNKLYIKDQQLRTLNARIAAISKNLDFIIDARIFEKGNQLVYDLDNATRLLHIFKTSMGKMEHRLQTTILSEQLEKSIRQQNEVDLKNQKFTQYLASIQAMINSKWEQDAEKIKSVLKQKADQAKISHDAHGLYQRVQMYEPPPSSATAAPLSTAESILPADFQHYPSCSCYRPNPDHPKPTLDLARLEMLSEREAREQLALMTDLLRKQRLLFRAKELALRTSHNQHTEKLGQKILSNSELWEQLAAAEKRETVLKRELLHTQQQLSVAEKSIQNNREEFLAVDAERVRLLNFKTSQYERMKELEEKVTKVSLYEKLDTEKLLLCLARKETTLQQLSSTAAHLQAQHQRNESQRQKDHNTLTAALKQEQLKSASVIQKMDQLKVELKLMETEGDHAVTTVWRNKCIELYECCQQLRTENNELRSRCRELIREGIELAESVQCSGSAAADVRETTRATKHTASTAGVHRRTAENGGVVPSQQLKQWGLNHSVDSCYSKPPHTQQQAQRVSQDYYQTHTASKPQGIKQIINEPPHHYHSHEKRRYGGGAASIDVQPRAATIGSNQQLKCTTVVVGEQRPHHQDSLMHASSTTYQSNDYGAGTAAANLTRQLREKSKRMMQQEAAPTAYRQQSSFDVKGTNIAAQASPRSRQQRKRQQLPSTFVGAGAALLVSPQETLALTQQQTAVEGSGGSRLMTPLRASKFSNK